MPHLERLAAETDVVPAVNQIEAHPYVLNDDVRAYGQAHGILTEAWSPIAQGQVLDDPVVVEVAEAVGRTPAQADDDRAIPPPAQFRYAQDVGEGSAPQDGETAREVDVRLSEIEGIRRNSLSSSSRASFEGK